MSDRTTSGWAIGWTFFAGMMMILMGLWWVFIGLVAIFSGDFFVATADYVFKFNTTAWGWIHFLFGIVVAFAGFGLFKAAVWARTVGVIIGVIASLIAFAWMPYYPVWSIMFIGVSVAIIWSLTVHGEDITRA